MKPSPATDYSKWGNKSPSAPAPAVQQTLLPQEKPAPTSPAEETAKIDERRILLKELETEHDIWDMRYWHKDHDMLEVMEYIANPEINPKFSRMDFVVERLKELGVKPETIAMAIDNNKRISFKHRLVPCGLDYECEPHKKAGNYSDCHCDLRCEQGLKDDQVDEAIGKKQEKMTALEELHKLTPEGYLGMKKANELLRVANEALARENTELKRKLGLAP